MIFFQTSADECISISPKRLMPLILGFLDKFLCVLVKSHVKILKRYHISFRNIIFVGIRQNNVSMKSNDGCKFSMPAYMIQ